MTRRLRAVGSISEPLLARHASAAGLETLEDILRWGGYVLAVVVQDEYTHDVVVRGHAPGFLVFDTT
jgi:hypothetical protein